MNKAFFAALAVSTALSGSAALAGQNDDLVARLNAADQENAALRRQTLDLSAAKPAKPISFADRLSELTGSFAADLPVAYKAPPPREPGRLTFWGEGGAIWTGGDRIADSFLLHDFTMPGNLLLDDSRGTIPGLFNLNPKIGWEGAAGFDYKFAGSPWHVSGQFRYGEGGKTSGTATSAGSLNPVFFSLTEGACSDIEFSVTNFATSCSGSETFADTYKETHWLADLTLGYDIAGSGPTYVQVKGGLRISEEVATGTNIDQFSSIINFPAGTVSRTGGIPVSAINYNDVTATTNRTNFLGAGPVIGLEGSVRFAGVWSFDYKGDLGVLFGTQKITSSEISTSSLTPIILASGMSGGFASVITGDRFVTMLSPDIQAGFGYWFTPNLKLAASYRIDGLIAVKNQKSADANEIFLPQRYWHGPRLTLTGQFAAD